MSDFFDSIEQIETEDVTVDVRPHLFVLSTKVLVENIEFLDEIISNANVFLKSHLKSLLFKNADITFNSNVTHSILSPEKLRTETKHSFDVEIQISAYGSLENASIVELVDFLDVIIMCSHYIFQPIYQEECVQNYYAALKYTFEKTETYVIKNLLLLYKSLICLLIEPNYQITEEIIWHSKVALNHYQKYSVWRHILNRIKKDNNKIYLNTIASHIVDTKNYWPSKNGFEKLLYGLFDDNVTVMLNVSPWTDAINSLYPDLNSNPFDFVPMSELFNSTFLSTIITQKSDDFKYDENDKSYVRAKGYNGVLEMIDVFSDKPPTPTKESLSSFLIVSDVYRILKRNKNKICHWRKHRDGSKHMVFEGIVCKNEETNDMDAVLCMSDFYDKDTQKMYSLNVRFCGSIDAVERAILEFVS